MPLLFLLRARNAPHRPTGTDGGSFPRAFPIVSTSPIAPFYACV